MNKLTKLAVFVGLAASASVAFANSSSDKTGFYAGVKLGESIEQVHGQKSLTGNRASNDTKNGGAAGVTAGYNFQNQFDLPFRTELDYTFRESVDSGKNVTNDGNNRNHNHVRVQTAMFNGYYDYYTGTDFTPWVSLGIGYSNIYLKSKEAGYSKTGHHDNLAWGGGVGVNYALNNSMDLDVGYKFISAGKAKSGDARAKVYTHDFTAGVNYYF